MNLALIATATVVALAPAAGPRGMPGWSDAGPYGWPGCVVNYDDTVIVCPHSRVYLAPSITWASHARPGTYHRVTLFDKDS